MIVCSDYYTIVPFDNVILVRQADIRYGGIVMAEIAWPAIDFTEVGPKLGERFPDVALLDQNGQIVDLHQVRGQRRALIVFQRSARW
jgi:hypothetical protein